MACCTHCAKTGGTCGGSSHAVSWPAVFGAAFGDEGRLGGYCGEKFAERVSASGGRTASKPCDPPWEHVVLGIACNPADGQAWFVSARDLFNDVRAAWNQLIAAENELQEWSASRKIREYITAYETEYQALARSWPLTFRTEYSTQVDEFKTNVKRGTCALQMLDDAAANVRARGGNVAPVPQPHGTDQTSMSVWPLVLLGVVLLAAGGVGGFLGGRELRKRGITL